MIDSSQHTTCSATETDHSRSMPKFDIPDKTPKNALPALYFWDNLSCRRLWRVLQHQAFRQSIRLGVAVIVRTTGVCQHCFEAPRSAPGKQYPSILQHFVRITASWLVSQQIGSEDEWCEFEHWSGKHRSIGRVSTCYNKKLLHIQTSLAVWMQCRYTVWMQSLLYWDLKPAPGCDIY